MCSAVFNQALRGKRYDYNIKKKRKKSTSQQCLYYYFMVWFVRYSCSCAWLSLACPQQNGVPRAPANIYRTRVLRIYNYYYCDYYDIITIIIIPFIAYDSNIVVNLLTHLVVLDGIRTLYVSRTYRAQLSIEYVFNRTDTNHY